MPESPRFYVASGHSEKAERILKVIAFTNNRALPPGKLRDINARVSITRQLCQQRIR